MPYSDDLGYSPVFRMPYSHGLWIKSAPVSGDCACFRHALIATIYGYEVLLFISPYLLSSSHGLRL
jgi:hypothetical protein